MISIIYTGKVRIANNGKDFSALYAAFLFQQTAVCPLRHMPQELMKGVREVTGSLMNLSRNVFCTVLPSAFAAVALQMIITGVKECLR